MKYFSFSQNNVGGRLVIDEDVTRTVIIEAENYEMAEVLMEVLTEGCNDSCPCCGDRWSDGEEINLEECDCTNIEEYAQKQKIGIYNPYAIIHYWDGRKLVMYRE